MDFNFNLKKTGIYQAVRLTGAFKIVEILKKLFLILFIIAFLLFLYGFILEAFPFRANQLLLGAVIISLTLFISCWLKQLFFNLKLKKPKIEITIEQALLEPGKYNLAEFLSFETATSVWNAMKFTRTEKLPGLNSTAFFYKLICDNPEFNFIFARAMLDLVWLKKLLKDYLKGIKQTFSRGIRSDKIYLQDFQDTIFESLKIAKEKNHQKIEIEDAIIALAKRDLIFKKILIDSGLKIKDIENLAIWLESIKTKIEERKKWFRHIVANKDIPMGTKLTYDMLEGKRPETGLSPEYLELFIGISNEKTNG